MKKFLISICCYVIGVTNICFAENRSSSGGTEIYYQTLQQDSVLAQRMQGYYDELDRRYKELPTIDISEVPIMKNTIKSRSVDSVILAAPEPMNQGIYNTCTGWAVCYAAASIRSYEKWQNWDSALCSPQYLYNQCRLPLNPTLPIDCSNSYSDIFIVADSLQSQGVCAYSLMPYDTTNCNTALSTSRRISAMHHRFKSQTIGNVDSVRLFKDILDHGVPIVVDMPIYNSFDTMWSSSTAHGVWSDVDTTMYIVGARHAVCIVGYNETKSAFKVMNSWGKNGGDNGFFWATYNVVRKGCFKRGLIIKDKLEMKIEGTDTLSSVTSAWYSIKNVPDSATIAWNITNQQGRPMEFYFDSPQGKDSILVRFGSTFPPTPPSPYTGMYDSISTNFIPPSVSYQPGYLSVTISYGLESYTTGKIIRRRMSGLANPSLACNVNGNTLNIVVGDNQIATDNSANYTIELWNSIYGLMRTKVAQSATEQMSTTDLPQGVYVVLLKENGNVFAETKVMIQ